VRGARSAAELALLLGTFEGALRLDEAVAADRLRLRGQLEDLLTALDCLDGYVNLSLRSAESAGLCGELLR
jgi:hypothetical protein